MSKVLARQRQHVVRALLQAQDQVELNRKLIIMFSAQNCMASDPTLFTNEYFHNVHCPSASSLQEKGRELLPDNKAFNLILFLGVLK